MEDELSSFKLLRGDDILVGLVLETNFSCLCLLLNKLYVFANSFSRRSEICELEPYECLESKLCLRAPCGRLCFAFGVVFLGEDCCMPGDVLRLIERP